MTTMPVSWVGQNILCVVDRIGSGREKLTHRLVQSMTFIITVVEQTYRPRTYLGVLSWRQNLVAFLTFQAHRVPVFAQRRLLLRYIFKTHHVRV